MSTHTPSPWVIVEHAFGTSGLRDIGTEDGNWVADGVRDRDARLIAAAPDLLLALQGLLCRAKDELADPEDVHEVHIAELAIAKATGDTK